MVDRPIAGVAGARSSTEPIQVGVLQGVGGGSGCRGGGGGRGSMSARLALGAWSGQSPMLHALAQLADVAHFHARTGVVGAGRLDGRLGSVQSHEA
eukprot:3300461-Prymnesium_polylepis.2